MCWEDHAVFSSSPRQLASSLRCGRPTGQRTPRGRLLRRVTHTVVSRLRIISPEMKPLIFVSCGQVTREEIQLGKDIVELIRRDGRYDAYFADNQSSLEGVTTNILAKLDQAAGFVAIMHPRGEVQIPSSIASSTASVTRASVWIEQEIAILAMLAQVQHHSVNVQVYTKRGITREGLRLYVMTNPFEFDREAEILNHFAQLLPTWHLIPVMHGVALSPVLTRQHHAQDPTLFTVAIALHNSGDEQAADARLRLRFPMKYIRHSRMQNETRRNSHLEIELNRDWFAGQNLFQELYPHETSRVLQEIHYFVGQSEMPINDVFEIEIRSGNTPAFKGRVAIAGLQSIAPDLAHYVLPESGGYSLLSPFSPSPLRP
jgi:hypothetical protein